MKKTLLAIGLGLCSNFAYASEIIRLHDAERTSLKDFSLTTKKPVNNFAFPANNELLQINQTVFAGNTYTRYQQYYQGIRVFGSQVILENDHVVNGEISVDLAEINDALLAQSNKDMVAHTVMQEFVQTTLAAHKWSPKIAEIEPIILIDDNSKQVLAFEVILQGEMAQEVPKSMHYLVDAQNRSIIKRWNDIRQVAFEDYQDIGSGGTTKSGKYFYGKDGLPKLNVTKLSPSICNMATIKHSAEVLRVVDAHHLSEKIDDRVITPISYVCGILTDYINESYNPTNDALFFGGIVYDMYEKVYGMRLDHIFDRYHKLIMRVHVGSNYNNAYWNKQNETVNFGDGGVARYSYTTSLDITAHEITHGVTSHYSGLVYEGHSGALDEALSDMAGVTAVEYLFTNVPILFYKHYKAYSNLWTIGYSVMKLWVDQVAMRYLDKPSNDGASADCYDPKLAAQAGEICYRSYGNVLLESKKSDPTGANSYLVHRASGIYNKAFYLMSQKIGVTASFYVVLKAQVTRWTPRTDFFQAACSIKELAVKENKLTNDEVDSIFAKVGLDIKYCK